MSERIVFLDAETVHISPGPATIWELAVILRTEDGDEEYLWQIRPDLTNAEPGALKVGGYYERCTVAHLAVGQVQRIPVQSDECPCEKPAMIGSAQLAGNLAWTLAGAHIIAANPGFDAGHLTAFLRANGECPAWDYHLTDLGSLVRGRFSTDSAGPVPLPWPLKIREAAALAGVDADLYDTHTALGDVRLLRDTFDAVTGRPS
jgi:hypothetical protein